LLLRKGHEVEILSQGEVEEAQFKFFPGFSESHAFHPKVAVRYASTLPIKRVTGFWSNSRLQALFNARHKIVGFNVVMVYNLKGPQVACANHAIRNLGLPVILEYEDDAFVDVFGAEEDSFMSRMRRTGLQDLLRKISGCIGVSPFLLSRVDPSIPQMLLRGVVGDDYLQIGKRAHDQRNNWVVFSGTHYRSKGLEPLIRAWKMLQPEGWQLHIAGHGELTKKLEQESADCRSIIFHGLLNREENAKFLGAAKIGINPHELSTTPGNIFAFKIIEYMAAGNHVITTPMGSLEPEIEEGLTYIPNNNPETIAEALAAVIQERRYERLAVRAAQAAYGPESVASALDRLLREVLHLSEEPS
jgi:glycosyltransferase involved in cell wall biosynthesis